jgi:hypothetical protein
MYPHDITDLTFHPMLHDSTRLRAALSSDTPRAVIEKLVRSLPPETTLYFYDPYHPSQSDPGAYVSVRLHRSQFTYGVGNHGWSSDRRITSPELMIEYLHLVRSANGDLAGRCLEVARD